MPDFKLEIPGIRVTVPFPIPGSGTIVSLKLTDGLLWMPEGIKLKAQYADSLLTLEADFKEQPVEFASGQLLLKDIKLDIKVTDSEDGGKVLDNSMVDPVVASGQIDWKGDAPDLLGLTDGLGFSLSYIFNDDLNLSLKVA